MESKVLQQIVEDILMFKEDHEHIIITENETKELILDYLNELAKELLEEVNKY